MKSFKGIGVPPKTMGTSIIGTQLKDLGIVIYMSFQTIVGNVPTILCLKDMTENGLDISLRERLVKMGDK